jgi:hypothetical protein
MQSALGEKIRSRIFTSMGGRLKRELDWIIPVAGLIAIEMAACLALSLHLRPQGKPPYFWYGMIAATVCAVLFATFSLHAAMKSWRDASPFSKMLE